ncbi:lipoxygenase family protein [Flavivirga jejuensis]|uniref:Lipoxygenase family protein n=1 Tax=Flavivirga jejuensis TaxID=870487 RepID=A0ABT8WJU8_9FLAO|nr:lipoxygenase family protein [Flavivirga jejuensis]MDO5973387.1 lipoxygenase family protein [Flavivirga jejuensis]
MNLKIILLLVGLALLIIAIFYFLKRRKDYGSHIPKLPLRLLGFVNIPAVPFQLKEIPKTLLRLGLRANATTQAKWGLNNFYQIDENDENGYSYLYGRGKNVEVAAEDARQSLKSDLEKSVVSVELTSSKLKSRLSTNKHLKASNNEDPITLLSLTHPEQFTMSWTTFNGVYDNAQKFLPEMIGTMTDVDIANKAFWPTIAKHGFAYNLLILKKVEGATLVSDYKKAFGSAWTSDIEKLQQDGLLYAIDLRMYSSLPVSEVKGSPRYTPATLTLLAQNTDKSLQPIAVLLVHPNENDTTIYSFGVCTNGSWLYALIAAKTSITLYGIWMGHVYHWHIVSAALLMTLNNNVEETHPLRVFMAPHSEFIIPFNDTLLLLWKNIAPPTSVSSAEQFLKMTDDFAKGRTFLQDDPGTTLKNNGIKMSDFSDKTDWDQFPIAGELLSVFNAVGKYVTVFVQQTWATDADVVEDKQLQAWIASSSNPEDGNVAGIPTPDSRENLITILNSLLFRLTAHGASRLNTTANPVLSFVPNLPPCLQRTQIPLPTDELSTTDLLTYLPKTGTIGEMITFLFTFVFSSPYIPYLPISGNETELIWGNDPKEPRNAALIDLRIFMQKFIESFEAPHSAQLYQWPRNIET